MYSYLEQNKTLSKEEKHFYANLLTKKKTMVVKNKVAFPYVMEKKIKAQTGSRRQ